MIDLTKLTTEMRNPDTMNLDQMTPLELAQTMNGEDQKVIQAVHEVLPQIAQAIEWAGYALQKKGRIIYIGAGTSGRLGVLDAVECPPTFGVDPGVVVGLIAGGESAFVKAVEGAEDSPVLCREELEEIHLTAQDLVIGIAASGRTPYVIHGLKYAASCGCRTIAIACNRNSDIGKEAQLSIEAETGPEVLTGSTRLKAGTAQKMILNMISTGSMVGIGKAYQNLMVDVVQSNEKLVTRAQNIVMTATECSRLEAKAALDASGGYVKTAIVMILLHIDAAQAQKRLEETGGKVRTALQNQL